MKITGITVGSAKNNNSFFSFGSTCFAPTGHHLVGKNGELNMQFRIQIEVTISYNNVY
jgi:hypothetical protein